MAKSAAMSDGASPLEPELPLYTVKPQLSADGFTLPGTLL
jgi:hypothetical protein